MKNVVLVFALAAASCASSRQSAEQAREHEPAAPSPLPVSFAPSTAVAAVSDSGPPNVEPSRPILSRRIELREPGREPRRALRYAFASGSRQKLRVQIETRLLEEDRVAAKAGLDSPLEVTIVEVHGDGSAGFRYELGPIAVSGTGARLLALDSGDGGSTRLNGSALIAANGELLDHRPDPPASEAAAEAEIVKSLLSSVVELPPVPVGAGGRWELVLEARSSEVALVRTTSYELAGFSGAGVRIRISQNEQVRAPDGGTLVQLAAAPSTGDWLVRVGRVFPEGKQTMKAALAAELRGELFTELRLVQR